MITSEYLKSKFAYDNGNLVWKNKIGNVSKNQIAGTKNSRGYIHIRLDMRFYQAHRLIWIYFNGPIEKGKQIDHINRDRSDNRIENLRVITPSENNRNSERSDNYNVGVWKKKSGKYQASYTANNKRHYLGTFETEEIAVSVRNKFIESLR